MPLSCKQYSVKWTIAFEIKQNNKYLIDSNYVSEIFDLYSNLRRQQAAEHWLIILRLHWQHIKYIVTNNTLYGCRLLYNGKINNTHSSSRYLFLYSNTITEFSSSHNTNISLKSHPTADFRINTTPSFVKAASCY